MSTRGNNIDGIDDLRQVDPARDLVDGPLDARALNDLQRAIAHQPSPDRPRRLLGRRRTYQVSRWRGPAVAAAATMIAVAGVPLIKAVSGGGVVPDGRPAGPWTYSLTIALPAGWKVYNQDIDRDSQTVSLFGPDDRQCLLTSFREGTFGGDQLAGRKPITVNGHHGFVATVRNVELRGNKALGQPTYQRPTGPVVAWEHAPHSWRLITCVAFPRDPSREQADSILIARAVRDIPRAVRTPYKVGYLPNGWKARAFGEPGPGSVDVSGYAALLVVLPPRNLVQRIPTDPMTYEHINISFSKPQRGFQPSGTRTTINGRPAWLSRYTPPKTKSRPNALPRSSLWIKGNGYWIAVDAVTADPDFTTELVRIAQHLTLASNPLDVSTWFDGNSAIP
jgi:hypothetical protein